MNQRRVSQPQHSLPNRSSLSGGIFQRKCACGQHTLGGGRCRQCEKEQPLSRRALPLQTKLTISEPGDKYEQEADRVADQIMRMPEPQLLHQATRPQPSIGQRINRVYTKCENEVRRQPIKEDEEVRQANAISWNAVEPTSGLDSRINDPCGRGQPLPQSLRNFFEPRFGHDFSGVRVHTDKRAAQLTRDVNARAFTVGRDLVFGAGQYVLETTTGQRLLAHELTHVVQQNSHLEAPMTTLRRQKEEKPEEKKETESKPCGKPIKSKDTLSEVSWGETSGIYPSEKNKFNPEKWDSEKTCELLKARKAIHEVAMRGKRVHKGKPDPKDKIDQKLKPYHLIDNFPSLDKEIKDKNVKWFYLSGVCS